MNLRPFTLCESTTSALIIDSPHSGRIYPVDFDFACPPSLLRQDEDAYVDELVIDAASPPIGASVLLAEFPRSLIDLNRAEDDLDPQHLTGDWYGPAAPEPAALQGYGLIRRICRNGGAMYSERLSVDEARRRIFSYYRPYHDCLRDMIAARLAKFGACYLIDAHSMPDCADNGVARADFVLGDRDGTACDPAFIQTVKSVLERIGYRVAVNAPYKGREILRRYGKAGQGAQALQLEINRRLYLDETRVTRTDNFDYLRRDITRVFTEIGVWAKAFRPDRQAAE